MKKYPLALPSITSRELTAVAAVLKSGVLSLGPMTKQFETAFAKKIGTQYACAVNSGTAGLHLSVIAAGIGPGDEVITTPFSFVASANCILYVGATPVFVDIDPLTYNIDPQKIEEKITKRTKAIVVVHIFGQPADMMPIQKIAQKHHLKIIEDACESIGATYRGQAAGTFGESAVFAFYPNKQMTTGEGGMIVTDNKRVYDLCKSLSNQGRSNNTKWLDHRYLGYNYRLDEMSAALGLEQLRRLDSLIAGRRRVAGWYGKALAPYADLVSVPRAAPGNTHTWFVYVVRVDPRYRDRLVGDLAQAGVSTKTYLPSIHLFDFYRKRFPYYQKGSFPVSETVSSSSLALPFYVQLAREEVRDIVKRMINVLTRYR